MQSSDTDQVWGTHEYYQQNMAEYSTSHSSRLDASSGNNNTTSAAAAVGKPIRRRSRASKRTPTTLVNANANNFRALVQQFTGNHTAPPPAVSSTYKGPINLNFAGSSSYSHPKNSDNNHGNLLHIDHQEHDRQSLFSFGTSTHEADPPFISPTVAVQVPMSSTTLSPEDFHMESFSGLQSGPGDYNNSINSARNDDFCWVCSAGDIYN